MPLQKHNLLQLITFSKAKLLLNFTEQSDATTRIVHHPLKPWQSFNVSNAIIFIPNPNTGSRKYDFISFHLHSVQSISEKHKTKIVYVHALYRIL